MTSIAVDEAEYTTVLKKYSPNPACTQAREKLSHLKGSGISPAPLVKTPSSVLNAAEIDQRNGYTQMNPMSASAGIATRL